MTKNGMTRIQVRLWLAGRLEMDHTLTLDDGGLDAQIAQLLELQRGYLVSEEPHMVEIEFLDEPNPLERFFRVGTDPNGMVLPARVEFVDQSDVIDPVWFSGKGPTPNLLYVHRGDDEKKSASAEVDPFRAGILFPRSMNDSLRDSVARALQVQLPELSEAVAGERAESLIAIATHYEIEIEPVLFEWIGFRFPGKLWSGAEWKRWCEKYTSLKRDLAARGAAEWQPTACARCGDVLGSEADAPSHVCRLICPHCGTHQLLRTAGGFWQCAGCGEVVA